LAQVANRDAPCYLPDSGKWDRDQARLVQSRFIAYF